MSVPSVIRIMRDRDIRGPLQQWLWKRHMSDPTTRFIHELEIPRPSARVDLAMINGRLAGYEIKSDADRLDRLERQATSFSQIFERMTIVVTSKHMAKVAKPIPSWWEIVVFEGTAFRVRRKGQLNPDLNLSKLLYVLTRAELRQVEVLLGLPCGAVDRKKDHLVAALIERCRPTKLRAAVRAVLKERPGG